MAILLENFCVILLFAFMAQIFMLRSKLQNSKEVYQAILSPLRVAEIMNEKNLAKSSWISWISFVFFAYSPSDWSVTVRLSRFPAMGHDRKSLDAEHSRAYLFCILL